ncbi:MAG: hypothetical protein R3B07_25875 [Polyangiaceae bacterium]
MFALSGCSADPSPPVNECPGPQATFDVRIFAAEGPLPGDTQVDVMFSSGEEVYQMDQPEVPLEAVRCSRELDGEIPLALDCALWTNGPATVTITASGYPELKQELVHELDECGIKTVSADLELMLPPVE